MSQVIVSLGSNIDPERNVPAAIERIERRFGPTRRSSLVWTEAVCDPQRPHERDIPQYLNGAVLIETDLSREALKQELRRMESELGRVRSADRYAPRRIDLDIVVVDGEVVDEDVHQRGFLRQAVDELLQGPQSS